MGYETETAPTNRKLVGLGVAVLFHVFLLYALTSGLGRKIVQKVQKTVNVAIIEEAKPPPPPPEEVPEETEPDTKPEIRKPRAFVPKVETNVKTSTSTENAITSTSEATTDATPLVRQAPATPAPAPPPAAPPKPKITSPKLMPGCSRPQYPQRSLDKNEEGTVVFRFLIGLDGSVVNSILVQSSGYDRLDQAAKEAFQRCKFVPGRIDGVPRQTWVRQPFQWRLR